MNSLVTRVAPRVAGARGFATAAAEPAKPKLVNEIAAGLVIASGKLSSF